TLTGTNTVSGVMKWTGGTVAGPLVVASNGVLNLTGSGTLSLENSLTNAGRVQKSLNAGTTSISITFYNSGDVDLLSGTMNFNGSPAYEPAGETLQFGVASLSTAGHVSISGHVSFDGELEVNALGSYVPNLGDALSLVSYGSETGAFSSLSLPPLGADQAWQISYTASALELQVVSAGTFSQQISGTVTNSSGQGVTNLTVFAYTT